MKDFKAQIAKPRELALYASLTVDFTYVTEVSYSPLDEHYQPLPDGERRERPNEGFVRITAPVTINFVSVDDDEIMRNAVKSIDAEEQKLRSELHKKLVELQERKSQLLALTHEPEEEEEQERDEPPDPDGECFRGGEYAASVAAEQAHIQRTLK